MIDRTIHFVTHSFTTAPYTSSLFALLFLTVLYITATEIHRQTRRIPLFDGPPGLPVLGNIHQIRLNAAEQYRLWSKQYGAVYQIMLGNVPIIVVNSAKSARELFGAHSQVFSSRPEFYTFRRDRFALVLHVLDRCAGQAEAQDGVVA